MTFTRVTATVSAGSDINDNVQATLCSRRLIVAVVLAAILVAGFALRVANLGGPDFGVDETFHVFAAQRLIAGDPPLLPSGDLYDRSFPFTRTVAWSAIAFGGLNEWTARVPGVVFGCLSILVVFIIGWRWYSATAGLVAAFVTAVAPMQIAQSRQVRMYALFQVLYLVIIYLLYQALETSSQTKLRWVPERFATWCSRLEMRPELLLVAAPIIVLALQTHDLILPSLAGPVAYVVGMGLIASRVRDVPPAIKWKYRFVSAVLLTGALLTFAFVGPVRGMVTYAHSYAPTWAQARVDSWRFYLYVLGERYPTIFGSFLLACVFALTRNWKATIYLFACFTLPFLLHSFLFAWKESRYLLHVMPLMFIVFGVGVSAFVPQLYRLLSSWAAGTISGDPRLVAGTLTIAAMFFMFGATKELREGVKLHNLNVGMFAEVQHYNWRKAMQFIATNARPSDVIITSRSLATRYYGPDLPLYLLNHQEMNSIVKWPRDKDGRPLDITTGAPVILDLASLQHVIGAHASGWFVTEIPQLGPPSIPNELVQYIERHLTPQTVPDADDMVVFTWGCRKDCGG